MSTKFSRSLIGSLALLAALVAGCSSSSHSGTHRTATHTHQSSGGGNAGGIPQNNGGDHDGDNNGGPSDGDGNH